MIVYLLDRIGYATVRSAGAPSSDPSFRQFGLLALATKQRRMHATGHLPSRLPPTMRRSGGHAGRRRATKGPSEAVPKVALRKPLPASRQITLDYYFPIGGI